MHRLLTPDEETAFAAGRGSFTDKFSELAAGLPAYIDLARASFVEHVDASRSAGDDPTVLAALLPDLAEFTIATLAQAWCSPHRAGGRDAAAPTAG